MLFKKLSATIDDAAELSKIAVESYSDHYLHLWDDNGAWYIHKCFSPAVLLHELMDSNSLFYIINENDENIGFIKLNIHASIENHGPEKAIELERIYFKKTATGNGFGKLTMAFIFEIAANFNKETIWLKAMDTSSAAIGFYTKMGFETCGKTRLGFAAMHEKFRGMVTMKKPL